VGRSADGGSVAAAAGDGVALSFRGRRVGAAPAPGRAGAKVGRGAVGRRRVGDGDGAGVDRAVGSVVGAGAEDGPCVGELPLLLSPVAAVAEGAWVAPAGEEGAGAGPASSGTPSWL
jgi:hypothetical protein